MDPVIHVSEGHRSDMLLDLSGLKREERVMGQTSISNERDSDRVAEALVIQHPHVHLRESQRRAMGRGKDGFKRVDNPNARWFRGKGKGERTCSGKSGASAHHANLTSYDGYDYYMMKTLMNPQTPSKPTMTQLALDAMTEKELWAMMMTRKASCPG